MTDSARFWDETADKYASKPVKDMASYEKTLDRTRKHLSPTDEVLEVGCGTGTTALLLAPSVGRITASDISARMIEIAREKAPAQGVKNVRFERGTVFDQTLEEESFDVVMAFNFLHLLEDVSAAVERVHALLKPGGLFVSKTVCLGEQTRLWIVPLFLAKLVGLAPTVRCLRAAELERTITDAGFDILETGFHPVSPPSRFVVAGKSGQTK